MADSDIKAMLEACRTIAVVGFKNDETEDAYRIPLYMQRAGYRVLPVNPKLAAQGERALGEKVFGALGEIGEPVDMVNLFRASENIPAHVDEILAMTPRPRAVWMQLGIVNNGSAALLRSEGIDVVQDRCWMVEHRRLLVAS